jgi:hypothetical protein
VDILEIDIVIAVAEFGSVDLRSEIFFECFLIIEDAIIFGAEIVSRKDAMVLQNIIAFVFLSIIIAKLDSNRILGSLLMFAIMSIFM